MASNAIQNRYLQDGAGAVPQPRLLVMLYDRLILDLEEAAAGIPKSDWDIVNRKLLHAQAIVLELHSALDKSEWSEQSGLGQLYTWFDEQITLANVKKDTRYISPSLKMIRDLRESWQQAYEQILTDQHLSSTAANKSTAAPAPV